MKLIHMRDSTVSTNAFAVFISLGVIILFTVIGIVSHLCVFQYIDTNSVHNSGLTGYVIR